MKKLVLFLLTMLIWLPAFTAEINSIEGSGAICSSNSTTYTAYYTLAFTVPLTTYDEVKSVKWQFIQNGVVIKTLNSSTFTSIAPTGSAKITVSGLPVGSVKIQVTLSYLSCNRLFVLPLSTQKTKDIFVGVPDATEIIGDVICPGASGVFSISALANATSYTWEVPAGWKVNGITGPVVASQGTSVTIRPCSDTTCRPAPFSTFTIKVKGVSTSCGQSNYFSKTIKIDHPISISETNLQYNNVKLTASPTNFPSYQWTLDPLWYFSPDGSKTLPEVSFNSRGITGLAVLTFTTPCQNTYSKNWWWVTPNTGGPGSPGNPGDPEPDPGDCDPEIPVSYSPNLKTMNVVYIKAPCDEELPAVALYDFGTGSTKPVVVVRSSQGFEYDISNLKPGMYVIQINTARGKHKAMKFIKVD